MRQFRRAHDRPPAARHPGGADARCRCWPPPAARGADRSIDHAQLSIAMIRWNNTISADWAKARPDDARNFTATPGALRQRLQTAARKRPGAAGQGPDARPSPQNTAPHDYLPADSAWSHRLVVGADPAHISQSRQLKTIDQLKGTGQQE